MAWARISRSIIGMREKERNRVNCETAVGIFFNTGSEIESRDIGFGLYSLSFLFDEILYQKILDC